MTFRVVGLDISHICEPDAESEVILLSSIDLIGVPHPGNKGFFLWSKQGERKGKKKGEHYLSKNG